MYPNLRMFDKVRKDHFNITVDQAAKLFGVSRMTYYRWVAGHGIPTTRADKVQRRMRQILLLAHQGWPGPKEKGMSSDDRAQSLLEQLGPAE